MQKRNIPANTIINNATILLYARCAEFDKAREIFEDMTKKGLKPDLVSWNIIINMHGIFGMAKEAEQTFESMIEHGDKPDSVTFVNLLNAFCHANLPTKALHYYTTVMPTYGITPTISHQCCVVDALARYVNPKGVKSRH